MLGRKKEGRKRKKKGKGKEDLFSLAFLDILQNVLHEVINDSRLKGWQEKRRRTGSERKKERRRGKRKRKERK